MNPDAEIRFGGIMAIIFIANTDGSVKPCMTYPRGEMPDASTLTASYSAYDEKRTSISPSIPPSQSSNAVPSNE